MLSIDFIRENPEKVQENARNKGVDVDIVKLLALDEARRGLIKQIDELRAERNDLAKSYKGAPSPEQLSEAKSIKEKTLAFETELEKTTKEFEVAILAVPNMASDDTPLGKSEADNQVVETWGDIPKFDFTPKNHWEIAEIHGWLDKQRAAKVTGARFTYVIGGMAELQLAIMKWVFDTLASQEKIKEIIKEFAVNVTDKPFLPVLPPQMISTAAFQAMDRLEPRDDRYKIEGEELWLQGSAEHVLGSMHMDEILEEKDLPIRYLGYATSFRREAGTYGKDTEGIIRMHQFDKLEVEILSVPEKGMDEHLFTIAVQEYMMRKLKLPYHKLFKCTADIGKPNTRGVDIEVWLPGQNQYRETHTADYMTDYQARRLKTRVRRQDGSIDFVHTIDATAFALGRTMVAILENYQTVDGGVRVPEELKAYLNNKELL